MAKFAQHFLINSHAAERIVTALDLHPGDVVFEIGPGKGALTSLLLKTGARVLAVDIDPVLVERLKTKHGADPLFSVLQQDVLEFDLGQLTAQYRSPVKVIGNLPYNITSPILRKLSEWTGWSTALLMVQKEVGDRLAAQPGSSDYGALTVGMNLTCHASPVFVLSESSFDPAPKVKSMVVRLERRPQPLTDDIDSTQRVIQAAFQQRRKTILNSLSHGLGMDKRETVKMLDKAGVDPQIRPEELPVQTFIALAKISKEGQGKD